MSKINAFRAVNVNYNNNAIRIEDETFHFDGESTLLSLANGGGKSVLVQMMMAPFVHKRYRDMPNRLFSSYFSTNKPTFLLVEWKLDGESGYVLTGMMVRARQSTDEQDSFEDLEMINFVHEYQEADGLDLVNLPIIEMDGPIKKLKGFNVVKQMFEEFKKERKNEFYCFDMSQSVQQRAYFQKIREYGIDCSEWENIIKKINLKESGLSELFKDAKDEVGLIEKWFLMAVDSKLNQQENKVRQFQQMLLKYVSQYKENESKMEQKQTILSFMDDTKAVKDKAEEQIAAQDKKTEYEGKITYLREQLEMYYKNCEAESCELEQQLQVFEAQMKEIDYEEISYCIYQTEERIAVLSDKMNYEKEKSGKLEIMMNHLQQKIDIFECAKLYHRYKEELRELQVIENSLAIAKLNEEEILPERDRLGYTLRVHYESLLNQLEAQRVTIEEQSSEVLLSYKQLTNSIEESRVQQNHCGKEIGKITERIHQYDGEELRFQKKYGQQLERNILGLYEEGTLEVLERQYDQEYMEDNGQLKNLRTQKLKISERIKEIERDLQDHRALMASQEATYKEMNLTMSQYVKELERRVELILHIGLMKKDQFDTSMILHGFEKKVTQLNEGLYHLQKERDHKIEQRDAIRSGQVIKVPKELEELLHKLDLHYMTGMEWIKKNGYSKEKNESLVRTNPMLPYSIIMSGQALKRLKEQKIDFFTSFPIPIIRHEDIELCKNHVEGGIYEAECIQFLVVFNHHLLDEEELVKLLGQMQQDIDAIEVLLARKQEEISFYTDVHNEIKYQSVTKESYDELIEKQEKQQEVMNLSKIRYEELQEERKQSDQKIGQMDIQIQELVKKIYQEKDKIQAFEQLREQYHVYCEEKLQLSVCHRKEEELKLLIKEKEKERAELRVKEVQLQDSRRDVLSKIEHSQEELSHYEHYKVGTVIEESIEEVQARYEAITKQIGNDVKNLIDRRSKQSRRCKNEWEELIRFANKRNVNEADYKAIEYDSYKQDQYETELEDKQVEYKQSQKKISEYNSNIAVQLDRLQTKRNELMNQFGTEEPKQKEMLIDIQFVKRKKLLSEQIKDENGKLKHIQFIMNGYQANLQALIEYEQLNGQMECNLHQELLQYQKESIDQLSMKELGQLRGELLRDYKAQERIIQNLRNEQAKILDALLRKDIYELESFHHPLETMVGLLEQPQSLYQQLLVVKDSYLTLLEKLEIDLGMVLKEKEKVMEMLMDYLYEVHSNLNRIDRNSTIQVKGRSIKMVRLRLPIWEEEKDNYRLRMTEYMDRVTKRSMERLEENGNIEELIGTLITTRSLYDSVVGIATIEIRLYKIEADREYQISWTDVSKNSGGEGFLSAFAVLSCLLSYMRRNDSDLFIEREEGKVIIMDNPFAQTNASHLLIPLMDIAKKSNTQLICLSGLSGESIYNRFDNIYVMNLIGSSLQKDLKYLKGEKIKGDRKIYKMSTSRLKVESMKNMELLF